jgi:cation diffusion facilitator family transporter
LIFHPLLPTVTKDASKKVVYAALAGNLAIAATKLVAALVTGSSAMLSEAIHSAVDTSNQGLLLYGMRRARRPPDALHPFGHGMEIYFWGFVVALLLFSLGGGVSIYEGVHKITHPEPIVSAWINFAVLGASMVFEGISFTIALRELRARRADINPWSAVRASKDPRVFVVLVEDSAALIGLAIATLGVAFAVKLDDPLYDGLGSIAVGVVLFTAAVVLARETHSLLTGESASRGVLDRVRSVLRDHPEVKSIGDILSMHFGPNDIFLAISLKLRDDVPRDEFSDVVENITDAIERAVPEVKGVFVRPHELSRSSFAERAQSPSGHRESSHG